MVDGSILEMFQRIKELKKVVHNNEFEKRLNLDIQFFDVNNMSNKAYKSRELLNRFNNLKHSVHYLEDDEALDWQKFLFNFDYEFGFSNINREFTRGGNFELMKIVVKELNKKFPEAEWSFVEDVPIWSWEQLNKDYSMMDEAEINYWLACGAVEEDGNYTITKAITRPAIIRKKDLQKLEKAKDNLDELFAVGREIADEKMSFYVLYEMDDNEYAGVSGEAFDSKISFYEGATSWFDIPFTPEEQIINDTIVKEIDERAVVKVSHMCVDERLNALEEKISTWQKEYDEFHASLRPKRKTAKKETDGKQDL